MQIGLGERCGKDVKGLVAIRCDVVNGEKIILIQVAAEIYTKRYYILLRLGMARRMNLKLPDTIDTTMYLYEPVAPLTPFV